jgi:DNA-3-methyladenine glycosylase II
MNGRRLTRAGIAAAVEELAQRDAALAALSERWGPPPLWSRPAGFATLLKIILEQQVSQASALAVWRKLEKQLPDCTADNFLALPDTILVDCGFSRQKMEYSRGAAEAVASGRLPIQRLGRMEDDEVVRALLALRGVGPWTAQVYLLMALCRPDVWPAGDLALQRAVQRLRQLERLPDCDAMDEIAMSWRPWRAVAARMLWHAYLSERDTAA